MVQDGLERKIDVTLAAIRSVLDSSAADVISRAEPGTLPSSSTAAAKLPSDGAHVSAARDLRPLESALRELLDPMLQAWLLENLSDLVRRSVEEELRRAEATTHHDLGPDVLSQPAPLYPQGNYRREGGLIRAMLLNRRLANGIARNTQEARPGGGARLSVQAARHTIIE